MRPFVKPHLTLVSENFMKRDFQEAQNKSLTIIKSMIEKMWDGGQNVIIGWNYGENFVDIVSSSIELAVKCYEKFPRTFEGSRLLSATQMTKICGILDSENNIDWRKEKVYIPCIIGEEKLNLSPETIDNLIKRFSISYTENRGIILFDIVKFSLNDPLEQLIQLKKLESYINKAESILKKNKIPINLCRTTTGDGYYIWNHNTGDEHDVRTFMVLALILIMNEMSDHKIPLRSAYTIGSHFTFHQIDKNMPRASQYIVGDGTITISRIINECLEGQILIDANDFIMEFISVCEEMFSNILYNENPMDLFGISVSSNDKNNIQKFVFFDKHNIPHEVYNIKINAVIGEKFALIGTANSDIKLTPCF